VKLSDSERREVLEGVDIKDLVADSLEETITAYIDSATQTGVAEDWDLNTLWNALKVLYPISFTAEQMLSEIGGAVALDRDYLLRESCRTQDSLMKSENLN
jgi:preprotein translocase subunit SecA